jgi:uridine kinase
VPEYDFTTHKRRGQEHATFVSAHDTDVVLVDGIFVLAVERLRKAFDLTLFTVEELDVCLARRLRRDMAERARSIESVLAQYLRFVRPGYVNFIEPSKNFADILVPRARDNLVAIEMVSKEISRRVLLKQEEAELARDSCPP